MTAYYIDADTERVPTLMKELQKLDATMFVADAGQYSAEKGWSLVLLETKWNITQIEQWLLDNKYIDHSAFSVEVQ